MLFPILLIVSGVFLSSCTAVILSPLQELGGVNPVTITNIHNKEVVETGFVVGSSSGTFDIGIEYDNGSIHILPASSTWKLALPNGGSTWKRGEKHTITYGPVVGSDLVLSSSITVIKGENHDINGDGYPDLLFGAPNYDSTYDGIAYVILSPGDTSSFALSQSVSTASSIITGVLGSGENFGSWAALGDINGDGYADLAISAQKYNSDDGAVYIFLSPGSSGFSSTLTASSANTVLTGIVGGKGYFGSTLSVGDINGDGYSDVVVAANSINSNDGAGYVFLSDGGNGFSSSLINADAAQSTISGSGSPTYFGSDMSIGDVNGDGYQDIVFADFQGYLYLFLSGGSTPFPSTLTASQANSIFSGGSLGSSVAIGDINGDGYADIVTGAESINSNSGAAYVFLSGGSTPFPASVSYSMATTTISGVTSSSELFGSALEIGDVNGDGYQDVAISAIGNNSNAGSVYVFLSQGSSGLGASSLSASNAQNIINGATGSAEKFGGWGGLEDLFGSGFYNLMVPASNALSGAGAIYLFQGGSSGITASSVTGASTVFNGISASNESLSVVSE